MWEGLKVGWGWVCGYRCLHPPQPVPPPPKKTTNKKIHPTTTKKQVPISWVGDALCNFGVPPPIQWTARIGDLIDGEQAFQILEVGFFVVFVCGVGSLIFVGGGVLGGVGFLGFFCVFGVVGGWTDENERLILF